MSLGEVFGWIAVVWPFLQCAAMPQVQLPIFPAGSALITPESAVSQRNGQVVYFNGHFPVFQHAEGDLASFRLFTTQLIVNGTATQWQIVRAFGVPLTTVKRYVKKYREQGAQAFFTPANEALGAQAHRRAARGSSRVIG